MPLRSEPALRGAASSPQLYSVFESDSSESLQSVDATLSNGQASQPTRPAGPPREAGNPRPAQRSLIRAYIASIIETVETLDARAAAGLAEHNQEATRVEVNPAETQSKQRSKISGLFQRVKKSRSTQSLFSSKRARENHPPVPAIPRQFTTPRSGETVANHGTSTTQASSGQVPLQSGPYALQPVDTSEREERLRNVGIVGPMTSSMSRRLDRQMEGLHRIHSLLPWDPSSQRCDLEHVELSPVTPDLTSALPSLSVEVSKSPSEPKECGTGINTLSSDAKTSIVGPNTVATSLDALAVGPSTLLSDVKALVHGVDIPPTDVKTRPVGSNIAPKGVKTSSSAFEGFRTDVKTRPAGSNVAFKDVKTRPADFNVASKDVKVRPADSNVIPTDAKTRPVGSNLAPNSVKTGPSGLEIFRPDVKTRPTGLRSPSTGAKTPSAGLSVIPTDAEIHSSSLGTPTTIEKTRSVSIKRRQLHDIDTGANALPPLLPSPTTPPSSPLPALPIAPLFPRKFTPPKPPVQEPPDPGHCPAFLNDFLLPPVSEDGPSCPADLDSGPDVAHDESRSNGPSEKALGKRKASDIPLAGGGDCWSDMVHKPYHEGMRIEYDQASGWLYRINTTGLEETIDPIAQHPALRKKDKEFDPTKALVPVKRTRTRDVTAASDRNKKRGADSRLSTIQEDEVAGMANELRNSADFKYMEGMHKWRRAIIHSKGLIELLTPALRITRGLQDLRFEAEEERTLD